MNKNLAVFAICLIALSALIGWVAIKYSNPSFLYLIISAIAAATFLVYFFIERTSSENFIKNYLLTIVIKLLAGGIFIAAIIFMDVDSAEANAITFMAAYLLFTGLEVGFLFRRFSKS